MENLKIWGKKIWEKKIWEKKICEKCPSYLALYVPMDLVHSENRFVKLCFYVTTPTRDGL